MLVELGVVEQRYDAVKEVLERRGTVTEVAQKYGVTRQSVHNWLRRYRERGMAGLVDRSKRPKRCPHATPARMELKVIELRRAHPRWGPARLAYELARRKTDPPPSRSSIYRILLRTGLIEPRTRKRRKADYLRWERARPMELWQLDVMEARLSDGSALKVLTGLDDHSRFCVIAQTLPHATARPVCEAFAVALRRYGIPQAVLTDNARVFTGRFARPGRAEVLFDRICRENGIRHVLTAVRSPTTTGKVERFHKTLRDELLNTRSFSSMEEAQLALDQYVGAYNALRPHQALGMAMPVERFSLAGPSSAPVTAALEGDVTNDAPRTEHVRRVDAGGKIWFAGARYYAGHGLRRDYVTVRIVDDEVRLYHRGALLRSHRRRHPKENEEVIYSHHREQTNRNVL